MILKKAIHYGLPLLNLMKNVFIEIGIGLLGSNSIQHVGMRIQYGLTFNIPVHSVHVYSTFWLCFHHSFLPSFVRLLLLLFSTATSTPCIHENLAKLIRNTKCIGIS